MQILYIQFLLFLSCLIPFDELISSWLVLLQSDHDIVHMLFDIVKTAVYLRHIHRCLNLIRFSCRQLDSWRLNYFWILGLHALRQVLCWLLHFLIFALINGLGCTWFIVVLEINRFQFCYIAGILRLRPGLYSRLNHCFLFLGLNFWLLTCLFYIRFFEWVFVVAVFCLLG